MTRPIFRDELRDQLMITMAFHRRKHLCSLIRPFVFAFGVWAACSSSVQAADYTLKQLLEEAAERHPSVLQARNQAQAAGFDVESAQWGRFPTVSSQLRSDSNLTQSLAKVEQPLWTGGKLTSRIELSEANLRAAEAGIHEAQFNALSQASTAFFEALRLTQRLQSATLNVTEHERLVGLIKRRSEAEISPPADTTLAQARLQQAVSERIQIKKQLDASLTTLAQWTIPLNGALKAPANILFTRPAEGVLLERAIANSAQRKRLKSQIESADAQISVSKAQVSQSTTLPLAASLKPSVTLPLRRRKAMAARRRVPSATNTGSPKAKSAFMPERIRRNSCLPSSAPTRSRPTVKAGGFSGPRLKSPSGMFISSVNQRKPVGMNSPNGTRCVLS